MYIAGLRECRFFREQKIKERRAKDPRQARPPDARVTGPRCHPRHRIRSECGTGEKRLAASALVGISGKPVPR